MQILNDICEYGKGKVAVADLTVDNYVSTENLLPNKGGLVKATSLPTTDTTQEVKMDDILVSNIRPYFKKIWHAKENGGCSNDVLVFRAKSGIDSTFLYYVLANDNFFAYATASSKGTKMPRGDKGAIMQYKVPEYNIVTQKKIARVLSNIDDKISINNKINRNLQEQAMTLYKKMMLGLADTDFTEGVLSDIADIVMGQSPKGDTYNQNGDGEVFYQGRAEFGDRFPTRRLFTTDPKRMANENSVLMSVRAPVGDINVAYEKCCIGRGLCAVSSKDNHQSFVLYTMYNLKHKFDVYNGEGTVFGSINRDAMNDMPIQVPQQDILDRFEDVVSPIDSMIRANYEENCRLISMRNFILPKLMSGELDLSNIDI